MDFCIWIKMIYEESMVNNKKTIVIVIINSIKNLINTMAVETKEKIILRNSIKIKEDEQYLYLLIIFNFNWYIKSRINENMYFYNVSLSLSFAWYLLAIHRGTTRFATINQQIIN